jgi:hypothetical protein
MATATKKREINWLFPEPDTEVTIKEYREHIKEAEHSESMTHYEFMNEMNEWLKKLL